MSKPAFTPGPWVVSKPTNAYWIDAACNFDKRTNGEGEYYYLSVSGLCTEADAHLIAAAPDMYEALEEALTFIEREYYDPAAQEWGEWLATEARPVHAAICAAIAKAEGRAA